MQGEVFLGQASLGPCGPHQNLLGGGDPTDPVFDFRKRLAKVWQRLARIVLNGLGHVFNVHCDSPVRCRRL